MSTFTPAQVLTAAELNAIFDPLSNAWTTFIPTLNNQGLGTGGAVGGAYLKVGKTVWFRMRFVFGTTPGTPSSSVWVSASALPAPVNGPDAGACVGVHAAGGTDFAPANQTMMHCRIRVITGAFGMNLFRSNTSAEISAANANYAPANGDVLTISGTYQAA